MMSSPPRLPMIHRPALAPALLAQPPARPCRTCPCSRLKRWPGWVSSSTENCGVAPPGPIRLPASSPAAEAAFPLRAAPPPWFRRGSALGSGSDPPGRLRGQLGGGGGRGSGAGPSLQGALAAASSIRRRLPATPVAEREAMAAELRTLVPGMES